MTGVVDETYLHMYFFVARDLFTNLDYVQKKLTIILVDTLHERDYFAISVSQSLQHVPDSLRLVKVHRSVRIVSVFRMFIPDVAIKKAFR